MQPSRPSIEARAVRLTGQQAGGVEMIGERSEMLLRRVAEIERALAVQEWWLLAKVIPEAKLLSELSSVLAVARGELEHFLAEFFGHPLPSSDSAEMSVPLSDDDLNFHMQDPEWVRSQRVQAVELLRMVARSLAPMRQFAQMLHTAGERVGLAVSALDALRVVDEHLNDAHELLQHPPE
jgi:hypothetical protein